MRTREEARNDDNSWFDLPISLSAAIGAGSAMSLLVCYTPGANLMLILPWLLIGGNSSIYDFADTTINALAKTTLVSFGVFAASYTGKKIAASCVGEKISDYVSHRQEEAIKDFAPHS